MRRHELVYALNAGGVDKDALSRVDLEKMRLAGEYPVTNWMPRVVGPMFLRPGLEYLARIPDDAATRIIPFVRSSATVALIGIDETNVAFYDADGEAVTVAAPPVLAAIADPTFAGPASGSHAGGWKNDSETGAGTNPTVSVSSGLSLTATRWRYAAVQHSVAIDSSAQSSPHTLSVVVARGPVKLRIGSAANYDDVLSETELRTGTHKLTFTPGVATIYIKFLSTETSTRQVTSCTFEHTALGLSAGETSPLLLPSPWGAGYWDVAYDQSIDVMFLGDGSRTPYRIERRGPTSWSIVEYTTRNGPLVPGSGHIDLSGNNYEGNGTLTASSAVFHSTDVGRLIEMTHNAQNIAAQLSGLDQTTDWVQVSGIYSAATTYADRVFTYNVTMSGTMTVSLERSVDPDGAVWGVVDSWSTSTGPTAYQDEQSNLLARYRFRVKAYTSGYVDITITYPGGSQTGLVRITGYSSPTSVTYETIKRLGATSKTRSWRRAAWSADYGWPRVPKFFDGRLWWFRPDMSYGSIVDDFDNYDDSVEGDSAPITRSIGSGAAEEVQWALDMQRLLVGTSSYEASIRSSSFDEPITPTKFTVRNASTLGCARVPAVKVDRGAIFVSRAGKRLYEMLFTAEAQDYAARDMSRLVPSAVTAGVRSMAVQRQPDTRVYAVLEDGTVVVVTHERDDQVIAFTTIEAASGGVIEDVAVLPSTVQDAIYFVVRYGTKRALMRLGEEVAQYDPATCILLDAAVELTGAVSSISGSTFHASTTVSVWADDAYRGTVALDTSGSAPLGGTYSRVVYGYPYTASFTGVKLAYAAQLGTALGQTKTVKGVSLILANSCLDGVRVGKDASSTDPMPDYVDGALRTTSQFFAHYDHDAFPIQSDWSTDARIHVTANSAYGPVTVQSVVLDIETREGVRAQTGG